MPNKTRVIPSANSKAVVETGEYAPELHAYLNSLQDVILKLQSRFTMKTSSVAPTAADIADTDCQIWKNTTSGQVRLYVNDAGTLKSVQLT